MRTIDTAATPHRVLVLLGTARDASLTCELLEAKGIATCVCRSALQLRDEIAVGAGAVLVAEECLDAGGAHEVLRGTLEGQPAWSDLPILVLARAGADSLTVGDAMALLGNVTLLERPLRAAGLVSVVRTALRARTRQYQIQAHLQSLEELREADALAAQQKDEFLAMLAHELRNPLAPIRTALHVLAINDNDAGRRRTLRDMMARQVEHMVRLVDDLLESSRLSRGKIDLRRERIDLRDALHRAVELSRPQIDAAGSALELRFPDTALPIDADLIRIAQVFGNLLNNAAKYARPGGTIVVTADHREGDAVVRVVDDGIGIEQDMLPHVFDMFTQGKRDMHRLQDGLGIGLALVRNLVNQHGGTVTADSAGSGSGSTFTVRLPLSTGGSTAATKELPCTPHAPTLHDGEPLRVLVVDDNEDAANALALVVDTLGMERRVAHDGRTALDVADAFDPAVVLLDIGMPGMDGYEVARRLRRNPRHESAVLVAVTGWSQAQDQERTREAGFDHHVSKPPDIPALVALIESVRASGTRH